MYGSIDSGGQRFGGQFDQQFIENYEHCDFYQQNDCSYSQSQVVNSFLNDFMDNNNNFNCLNQKFDSDVFFKPLDTGNSPPPTPDIITTFSNVVYPYQDNTSSYSEPSPLVYQNMSSPPMYSEQSPSSISLSSPSSASTSTSGTSFSLTTPSPLTVDETKTKLIKESLRLTIQNRRAAMGFDDFCDLSNGSPAPKELSDSEPLLTIEDEERRKRRKERNKVAAAKCRNKKKQHSVHLVQEFQTLESSNDQLKKEITDLQKEKQKLIQVLKSHQPQCQVKRLQQSSSSSSSLNKIHNIEMDTRFYHSNSSHCNY